MTIARQWLNHYKSPCIIPMSPVHRGDHEINFYASDWSKTNLIFTIICWNWIPDHLFLYIFYQSIIKVLDKKNFAATSSKYFTIFNAKIFLLQLAQAWPVELRENLQSSMFGQGRQGLDPWLSPLRVPPRLKLSSWTEKMDLVMSHMWWMKLESTVLESDSMKSIFLTLPTKYSSSQNQIMLTK